MSSPGRWDFGKNSSILTETGLKRLAGIELFGNGVADTARRFPAASVEKTLVAGSQMLRPEAEKSPVRMRSGATLENPCSVLVSRRVSKFDMKNNLSRIALPLSAKPNWLRWNGFFSPTCRYSLASKESRRANSKRLP